MNRLLGLLLGADEEDLSALRDRVDDELIGRLKHPDGLLKIDDVDSVASPEDIGFHFRVPLVGLVTEVNPRLKQQLHGNTCHTELLSCFFRHPHHLARELFSRRKATSGNPGVCELCRLITQRF